MLVLGSSALIKGILLSLGSMLWVIALVLFQLCSSTVRGLRKDRDIFPGLQQWEHYRRMLHVWFQRGCGGRHPSALVNGIAVDPMPFLGWGNSGLVPNRGLGSLFVYSNNQGATW